ncbi:MAG TPA: HAMP domain-containing sensor histidine kinase [Kofleriaceae bacterium]|jgi:signal transduction histidine kinase
MSPSRPRRQRLVIRVYGFVAALSLAVMTVFAVLPRYWRSSHWLEPHAALMQNLVNGWAHSPDLGAASMGRVNVEEHARLTLYTRDIKVVRSNVQPPLEPPTPEEITDLQGAPWSLDWGRIVVRSDDGSLIGIYQPNRAGFPWNYVLPLGALVLLVVGGASFWFTSRLARPLDHLAIAARSFGAGDVTARANLGRSDELGDLGRAFDDMADRTAAVMAAQRQLMADVSHELRTPLARIRVALELVVEDPVAAKDVLADVTGDLDEIDQLISDILTTARLDTAAEIARAPTTIGELTNKAVARFKKKHPGRTLELTDGIADRSVACDAVLLRRAIDNLLDNAVKYSESPAPVSLAVVKAGDRATFEVVDHGIGMTPEDLERAGTPFWRADGSRTRRTGGVGLGLALARRIARAHGGDIVLDSAPGKGTTARLQVPLS